MLRGDYLMTKTKDGFSAADALAHERARQRAIARRDVEDRQAEQLREAARINVESGNLASLDDARLGPTPEQLEKAEYRTVQIEAPEQTAREVTTLRRVTESRIVQLHQRGVLDDDMFAACRWYRERWERSGLDTGAAIAAYDGDPRGEKLYGVMPRTEAQAEARSDWRFARSTIPLDVVGLFESVVLAELTISDAARASGCRYANAQAAFVRGALALHGGIAHLLPIRGVLDRVCQDDEGYHGQARLASGVD